MSLTEFGNKIKGFIKNLAKKDYIVVIILVLVGIGGFMAGRLVERENLKENVYLDRTGSIERAGIELYVASKTGSIYYFPWCSGAMSIASQNKVWFESREDAEAAGYKKAGNCKGL